VKNTFIFADNGSIKNRFKFCFIVEFLSFVILIHICNFTYSISTNKYQQGCQLNFKTNVKKLLYIDFQFIKK